MDRRKETILIVDDSEFDIDLLLGILDDYDLVVATDGPSALDILARARPDLVLLDIDLPGIDGFELCARIKANQEWAGIPVLFITAHSEEANILKAFDLGGGDYVTKPFRPRELFARIRSQLQYQRVLRQLRGRALTDALTGIANRRAFFTQGSSLYAKARAQGENLTVIRLDLDDLKGINDRLGYASGDLALQEFAHQVSTKLEQRDLFARLGGTEFAILLPGQGATAAESLLQRLDQDLPNLGVMVGGERLGFKFSSGLAEAVQEMHSLDQLLNRADEDLWRRKPGSSTRPNGEDLHPSRRPARSQSR